MSTLVAYFLLVVLSLVVATLVQNRVIKIISYGVFVGLITLIMSIIGLVSGCAWKVLPIDYCGGLQGIAMVAITSLIIGIITMIITIVVLSFKMKKELV